MLAQASRRLDVTSRNKQHVTPRKTSVQPTSFMFIDASNGGVNAKPDKVVRSFVMKSARNKKPWSTKPKSPISDTPLKGSSSRRPSLRLGDLGTPGQTSGHSPQSECDTSPASWDRSVVPSPSSDSVISNQNSNWAYESPLSTHASPRAENSGSSADDTTPVSGSIDEYRPQIIFQKSFHCLSVRLDTYTEGLIHQFVEFTTPNLLPIDLHRSSRAAATHWVASCLQSPVATPFIYAALTTSSKATQRDSNVYKWRAMSAVNKLLANNKYSTDDTTIASVLILLALEESDLANPRQDGAARISSIGANDAHLRGLQAMITQRGGLAALGGNRCLQICILMHSVAQAVTTFRRPYALLLDTSGHVEDYCTVSSTLFTSTIIRQCCTLGINNVLVEITRTISIFVADITAWYDTGTSLVDPLELQKHATLLMYRLFDWYDRRPEGKAASVDQSVCLALLIFLTHATEPTSAPVGCRLAKVTTALHSSLSKTSRLQWSNAPEVYLWIIIMGALGAQGLYKARSSPNPQPHVDFFMEQFEYALGTTMLNTAAAAQVMNKLQSCLWIPSVFNGRLASLWNSLESHQSSMSSTKSVPAEVGHGPHDNDDYALGQSTTMRFFFQRIGSLVERQW